FRRVLFRSRQDLRGGAVRGDRGRRQRIDGGGVEWGRADQVRQRLAGGAERVDRGAPGAPQVGDRPLQGGGRQVGRPVQGGARRGRAGLGRVRLAHARPVP